MAISKIEIHDSNENPDSRAAENPNFSPSPIPVVKSTRRSNVLRFTIERIKIVRQS